MYLCRLIFAVLAMTRDFITAWRTCLTLAETQLPANLYRASTTGFANCRLWPRYRPRFSGNVTLFLVPVRMVSSELLDQS